MYIEPGTNIRLLHNVPLDTTYDHTIYFSNATAQASYFSGLTKYNLNGYTYQRVNKGVARVGIKADSIYDCNYMMFQNTNFGSKWFYAFITKIEYVNNVTSEITFEIDVMQTWFFDCEPDYCFVERIHTATDVIGEHIEPENLDVGEYVFNSYGALQADISSLCVIVAVIDKNETLNGNLYDGIYGAATLKAFNSTDVSGINEFLYSYIQQYDNIISIYIVPKFCIKVSVPSGGVELSSGETGNGVDLELGYANDSDGSGTIDGYEPKNKKLFTYPYNFYHIDNANGGSMALRFEFFTGGNVKVRIESTVTQPVQLACRPKYYKGVNQIDQPNNCECLTIGNFPICSWSVDSYQAWLAQNSIPLAANTGLGAASLAAGALVGGVAAPAIAVSGVALAANTLMQGYRASIASDIVKGSANNGGVNTAHKNNNFYGGRMSITAEYAKMIDDYFNMYGYAVKCTMKPNRNARPHWTYVKTINCTVTGSVPCDDMRRICDIYNSGITFWANGSEVGNYTLDNSPN